MGQRIIIGGRDRCQDLVVVQVVESVQRHPDGPRTVPANDHAAGCLLGDSDTTVLRRVAPLLSRHLAIATPDQTARVRPLSCAPRCRCPEWGNPLAALGRWWMVQDPGRGAAALERFWTYYQPDHCPAPQRCVSPRPSSQSPSPLDCRVPNTSLVGPQQAIRSIQTKTERQRRVRRGGYGDATGKMLDIVRAFFAGAMLETCG
jgi:hypothetical protein